MSDDLRSVLSAAYDAASSSETPAPGPVETTSTAAPGSAPDTSSSAPAPDAAPSSAPTSGRARDEAGRFLPKSDAPAAAPEGAQKTVPGKAVAAGPAKAGGVEGASAAPPAPAVEAKPLKIPQSWKPAMRELAQKLPAEFHGIIEEAFRRDVETQKALQDTAQARQIAAQVQQTLAPYETIARANGMDAMSYAGSVLQTAAVLQMGTQTQKDQALALLIQQFGGTVDGINAHLSGQAPATPTQTPVDVNAAVEKAIAARLQTVETERASQEAAKFVESAPEFLQDVWQDMVELIQVAERQGRKLSYQQAYDRACRLNDDVQKVIDQRKAADAAKAQAASTQRAAEAASSIRSQPTAAPAAQPAGLRAVLDSRYDELAARGR
jgi:hypothetical protein